MCASLDMHVSASMSGWCLQVAVKVAGRGAAGTCKMLGHSGINGTRAVGHCVVLGYLSEQGRVIAMGPQQGQVAGLAGLHGGHTPIQTGQVNGILCHAPVCCPLATCTPALLSVVC